MILDEDEMVRTVKEVGSDVKLLSDFLAKMCLFIALDSHVEKFEFKFETTPANGKQYSGVFEFKEV